MAKTQKTLTATVTMHKDVRGREMPYLLISDGTDTYAINVGVKTFETVKQMQDGTKPNVEKGGDKLANS